jgi:2-octaprenylphenol hydroxylase
MTTHYDVVIVGSGMVGNTLACALLQHGLHVALIETTPALLPIPLDTLDIRTFAITRASERIFAHVGAWSIMQMLRVSPFQYMHVWDEHGKGKVHFDCTQIHQPILGHIVEQSVIQTALLQRLAQFENLTWYRPAKVKYFQLLGHAMQIILDDERVLTTQLLVGAEGANSTLRTAAGIPYLMQDYGQHAIVANVTTELSHQHTAWQRFLGTGPLAFLPLPDEKMSSIVWSADTPAAHRLMRLDKAAFQQALAQAFEYQLGEVIDCGQRAIFPLQRRHAQNYIQPRFALVGDAAHTIHPLAGQGVNLGLLDAASLSQIITEARADQRDFGAYATLRKYERWRKGETMAMMAAMDGFKRLFASELPIVQWARSLGLNFTDVATPLKQVIMRHAMGLAGDLPQIATQPIEN